VPLSDDLPERADGWPACPVCGWNELYSLAVPPTADTIAGCWVCGPWRNIGEPPPSAGPPS